MTWVKICGITNVEDALTAADAGADALGFVFYEKSPRYVTPEVVGNISQQLPAQIEKVGVFVDETLEQMEDMAKKVDLTGIQRHLSLSRPANDLNSTFKSNTTKYIAIRANELIDGQRNGFLWGRGMERVLRAVFIDTGTETQPGGTGKTFDWKKAVDTVRLLQETFRVVVAGGLTPTNVPEAMRILKPWGVDVSTGVEARLGKKDREKVRAFIAAVRGADNTSS